MPASNEGDYKTRYRKEKKKMLGRPTKGSHELLKLRFAEGFSGDKKKNA